MSKVVDVASLEWQPVRPDVARGTYGRTLLANGAKVVLTRASPGGGFPVHRDDYDRLFSFLGGEGLVWAEEKQYQARAGLVVHVTADEAHATQGGNVTPRRKACLYS